MDIKPNFQRSFLIFVNEDKGYESVQKPAGRVKIEVREGRGKLWASVQNLLESGKFSYKLYLINTAFSRAEPVPVGPLELIRGKGVLEWEFNPLNVANAGSRIEDYGIAAVLVEYRDRENTSVICPLAAYRGKKTLWRNGLAERLYIKKPQQEIPLNENITSKHEGVIKSKYVPPETESVFNVYNMSNEKVANIGIAAVQDVPDEENAAEEEDTNHIGSGENAEDAQDEENTEYGENPEDAQDGENAEYGEDAENTENRYAQAENFWLSQPESLPQDMQEGWGQEAPTDQTGQEVQYQKPEAGLNTDCLYLNSNMCGAYVNTGVENPCGSCTLHSQPETADSREETGNIERLRSELDNNFEKYDPFHVKRSDYSWWKVTNPVNLNNILFQCNIRSPLLFNPAVMVSHFKYRHLIVGIYTDRFREKEYVVCGVFGMHMVDRKPFGDMCRWVQTEGTRPKYGAFGYWIVYLDPATGKILSLK